MKFILPWRSAWNPRMQRCCMLMVFALPLLRAQGGAVQVTELADHLQAVQGTLQKGVTRMANKYSIVNVPPLLEGLQFVTIDRGELYRPGKGYAFTVDRPVTVYLAVQERGDPGLPSGWSLVPHRMSYVVPLDTGGSRTEYDSIWKKKFPAGRVRIPPHEGTDENKHYGLPHMAILEASDTRAAAASPAPAEPQRPAASRTPPPARTALAPTPAPAPAAAPSATPSLRMPAYPGSYQQTASQYNQAIAAYQEFLQTRRNPANLKILEDTLRNCAEGFDDFRRDAPGGVNVDTLIEQCNKAIFAVHATRLAPD